MALSAIRTALDTQLSWRKSRAIEFIGPHAASAGRSVSSLQPFAVHSRGILGRRVNG